MGADAWETVARNLNRSVRDRRRRPVPRTREDSSSAPLPSGAFALVGGNAVQIDNDVGSLSSPWTHNFTPLPGSFDGSGGLVVFTFQVRADSGGSLAGDKPVQVTIEVECDTHRSGGAVDAWDISFAKPATVPIFAPVGSAVDLTVTATSSGTKTGYLGEVAYSLLVVQVM